MRLSLSSWVALELDPPEERDLFLDLYRHDPNWADVGPSILALHDWAVAVGVEEALRLAGTTWQASAAADMSVSTHPGATELTRTRGPSSEDQALVAEIIAPLEAAYGL